MRSLGQKLSGRSALLILIAAVTFPRHLLAQGVPCPAAKDIPQLTIDYLVEPMIPLNDRWQVLLDDVPLSDIQVAQLAGDTLALEKLNAPMENRGQWVFWSLVTATAGIGVSATGFVLFGQNELSSGITLSMALGGVLVGLGGVLLATEAIQASLRPYLAPPQKHRLSRAKMRQLVFQINHRFYREVCSASAQILEATLGRPGSLVLPKKEQ